MRKQIDALKLAGLVEASVEECMGDDGMVAVIPLDLYNDLMTAIREALAEQPTVLEDPHPPHRLCECTACLEYWTPLPDCDAFAASGKPIAEQTNTQFMEGYRVGLAEMREKCAKVCDDLSNPFGNASLMAEQCAAAIRAINFEGDTGFRPVSEMIAEHKQDPKKAAAIEKAKMRKAKQEPVAWMDLHKELGQLRWAGKDIGWDLAIDAVRNRLEELYAAPVQQVDLTDDEIFNLNECESSADIAFARAVIAADREKNK